MIANAKYNNPLDAIRGVTRATTKDWARQRKAEERDASAAQRRLLRLMQTTKDKMTIKDAAFEVMQDAYNHASTNGKYPVNARQIYYAARGKILDMTGRDELQSQYFLQTVLTEYMETHDCSTWDIVWDARGHFREPHTGKVVPLGTLQVRQYLGERPYLGGGGVTISGIDDLYPTIGPENRYKAALFVEKEGFDPVLEGARLEKKYDVGILSTKGMSVTAARELLDGLAARGVTKMLCLRDFDIKGFSIFGTLGRSGRRYRFANKVPLEDIGLRLADCEEMDLLSEPGGPGKQKWSAVSATLRRHGATDQEIAFLARDRVELNAMTSEQLIAYIEGKFHEHGITKVIPDAATLERHARRTIEQRLTRDWFEAVAVILPDVA